MAKAELEQERVTSQEEMDELRRNLEQAPIKRDKDESKRMSIWRGCRIRCRSSRS